MSNTTTVVIIGAVVLVGGLFLVRQNPMLLGQLKQRVERISNNLIHNVSASPGVPDFGVCTCDMKTDKFLGPKCKIAGGSNCSSDTYNLLGKMNCVCRGGTLTGLGCPAIGMPCYQNQYKYPGNPTDKNNVFPNFTQQNNLTAV